MTAPIKLRRLCAGAYVTRNLEPTAHIERSHMGGWTVSYGDYYGLWSTKAECLGLLESVAEICLTEGSDVHCYPVKIISA